MYSELGQALEKENKGCKLLIIFAESSIIDV